MIKDSTKHKLIRFCIFLFCTLILFFGKYIPIEIAIPTLKTIFYWGLYFVFPVFLIWSIIDVFKIKQPGQFATFAAIIYFLFSTVYLFLTTICGINCEVILKNKLTLEKIERRSYGCGAYDSQSPVYTYYKLYAITPLFNYVSQCDISQLDTAIWKGNDYFYVPATEIEKAALEKAAKDKSMSQAKMDSAKDKKE